MIVMQHKRETSGRARPEAVAVAVKGVVGDSMGGAGSRRAVQWAAVNLLPKAARLILVHIIPTITSVPTPTGERIPVDELNEHVVEMYVRDIKLEFEKVFVPFKRICSNNTKVETLLIEHDDPAKALIGFISRSGINSLVMGSFPSNVISRLKGPGIPSTVLRYAPTCCEIYIVCKDRIVTKSVDPLLIREKISSPVMSTPEFCRGRSVGSNVFQSPLLITAGEIRETSDQRSLSVKEPEVEPFSGTYDQTDPHSSSNVPMVRAFGASRVSQHSYLIPQSPTETNIGRSLSVNEPETEPLSITYNQTEQHSSACLPTVRPFGASRLSQHSYLVPQSPNQTSTGRSLSAKEPEMEAFDATYNQTERHSSSGLPMVRPFGASRLSQHSYLVPQSPTRPLKPVKARAKIQKEEMKAEVKNLKEELQNTVAKYKLACEELVNAQNKVQMLSSECLDEARRVNLALEKEETMRKAAAIEKEKHLEAMKEVEAAKALLAKEFCERQIAEVNVIRQNLEKRKIIDQLLSSDARYRRYSKDEIETATNYFNPENVIGEGGYGKVYKCSLYHTPVAVKVLRPDSVEKKEEFLKEVEVLSQLRHPHLVLLLGACPEGGCLVYEHLENGSLREHIYHRNNKPPLPWFIRFRIIFEVACGLAFLHSSKPEPIIHRDLKPGNILLDRNYVSKIGDVGLAKLVSEIVPDNVTTYQNSVLAGTLYYMDPEYQRTGTIRPKSDLYAFGIIILQLLTARHPNGLLTEVEDAVKKGTFTVMLDKSVTDWPLAEAEELARIGLKCSEIRCRDRPDLENEVIPVLKRLAEAANAKIKIERSNLRPPSHYFCPILREIMEDPHIAVDGFTYERRAILAWLEKHKVSPVTKRRLKHFLLTPNHTLRSAIQDWRSRLRFSSALIHKDC